MTRDRGVLTHRTVTVHHGASVPLTVASSSVSRLRRGCRTVIRCDVKRPHHPVRSPISRRDAAPLAPPWDPQTRQHSGSAPRRRNDQRPFRRGDRSVFLQSEVTSLQRCGVKIPRLRRDCPAECVCSPRSWANPPLGQLLASTPPAVPGRGGTCASAVRDGETQPRDGGQARLTVLFVRRCDSTPVSLVSRRWQAVPFRRSDIPSAADCSLICGCCCC